MSRDRTGDYVDQVLNTWFTDGPTELPDRTVAAIADQLDDVHQRGALGLPGRLSMPRFLPALVGAAIVLVAAVGVGVYFNRQGIGVTPTPSPSPALLARGDFVIGAAPGLAIELEATGEGSNVTGNMIVSEQVTDPAIDDVFTVELHCTRTTADGVIMIGGVTTEGNGVSPEGAWAAIVLEPGSRVKAYVLSQRGGPSSEAASCMAYLEEKEPARGGFPGLTPIDGFIELGPTQ